MGFLQPYELCISLGMIIIPNWREKYKEGIFTKQTVFVQKNIDHILPEIHCEILKFADMSPFR